eukprot:6524035-Ditylum_brightwellii.AAC.1
MERAIDSVYKVFLEVQLDGSKVLDEDFIMNIFSPFCEELPELEDCITYYFEEKELNVIGSCTTVDCVLAIDEARAEIFYPAQIGNCQTNECCIMLSKETTNCIILEMTDTQKATSDQLS